MIISETEYGDALTLYEENGNWLSAPCPIETAGSLSSVNYIKPDGDYDFRLGGEKIWWGNMEDQGCSLWNLNSADEKFCDTVAFGGNRSIQHQRDPGSPYNIVTNFENRIICCSDTLAYTLCGYIKTMNGSDVTIEIQYYEDRTGGIAIGQENIGVLVSGDTPWTYYYKNLTIPQGTEFFDIRLNSDFPQEGIALSWFDNVSLICWNSLGTYQMEEAIPMPNDFYFIQAGSTQNHDNVEINYSESVFEEPPVEVKKHTNPKTSGCYLQQNSPNPFNPSVEPTKISFHLDNTTKVIVSIIDVNGQKIILLTDKIFQAGNHNLFWDGKNSTGSIMKTGVYFYQLETPNIKEIKKCVLLRK